MVMIWGTFTSIGVYFESLVVEFGWTRALVSGSSSANYVVFGIICIVVARLTDKFGPRIVITICGLFLGLGLLLMSQIKAEWHLYLFFGLIIAIGGSAYITILSIVAKWFERRRGMMTAIVFSGMGLGTMIIGPIATRLIAAYDWRTSYIILTT